MPVLHGAGESDPGSDFVTAGAGLRVDFVVCVLGQLGTIVADQSFQKPLVEGNVDFAVFGFARPMGQATGSDKRDALGMLVEDFAE